MNNTKEHTKVCGIDVSKHWFDAYVLGDIKSKRYKNNNEGHSKLLKHLKSKVVMRAVMESTGGYERSLAEFLFENSFVVSVVNPAKVRAFSKAKGIHAKTDLVDAKLLALFGEELNPGQTELPSDWLQGLRNLVSRRRQLQELQAIEKNHLKAPLISEFERESIEISIKSIKNQVKLYDEQIVSKIKSDESSSKVFDLLCSFKGIGAISASVIIAYVPELGVLDRKKIAAIVGLVPYEKSSGLKLNGRGSIYGGRKQVRDSLYMAVISAIRTNRLIKRHYLNLKSKGKPHKVAIIACMRKMLITLNAIARDEKPWDEQRFTINKQEYGALAK